MIDSKLTMLQSGQHLFSYLYPKCGYFYICTSTEWTDLSNLQTPQINTIQERQLIAIKTIGPNLIVYNKEIVATSGKPENIIKANKKCYIMRQVCYQFVNTELLRSNLMNDVLTGHFVKSLT